MEIRRNWSVVPVARQTSMAAEPSPAPPLAVHEVIVQVLPEGGNGTTYDGEVASLAI